MNTRSISIQMFLALFLSLSFAAPAETPVRSDMAARLVKAGFYAFRAPVALEAFTVPSVAGIDGTERPALKLANLAGKVTLLNFWATWCPPCRQEMPSINRLNELMKGTNFQVAAISVDDMAKTVSDFIAKAKYTYPVYVDTTGQLASIYASQGIPTTYIIDKSGKVIAAEVGSREYDDPEIVAILKDLAK